MSLPALNTKCGQGFGLAVCRSLGLVVTSNVDDNSLSVFALPDTSALDSALLIGGPASLALVPGLGLLVREWGGEQVRVLALEDDVAMASMSPHRVGWMVAAVRAVPMPLLSR